MMFEKSAISIYKVLEQIHYLLYLFECMLWRSSSLCLHLMKADKCKIEGQSKYLKYRILYSRYWKSQPYWILAMHFRSDFYWTLNWISFALYFIMPCWKCSRLDRTGTLFSNFKVSKCIRTTTHGILRAPGRQKIWIL